MFYMAGTFMFFESKSGESKCHFLITFIIKCKKTVDQEKHPVVVKYNKKWKFWENLFLFQIFNDNNNLFRSHTCKFN